MVDKNSIGCASDLPYVYRRGVQYAKFSYQGIGVTIRYNLYHDMYVHVS